MSRTFSSLFTFQLQKISSTKKYSYPRARPSRVRIEKRLVRGKGFALELLLEEVRSTTSMVRMQSMVAKMALK